MQRTTYFVIFLCFFFLLGTSFSQEIKTLPEFTAQDRVLILAPHPDDESIGTGGVIQRALASGAFVKIACLTNGDHNQWSFILYEKRIPLRNREFIHLGEVRRSETITALKLIGLSQQQVTFLGYPDAGTLEIMANYWDTSKPFRSLLTRISQVPYQECLSCGSPYVGESILKDLKTVLLDYRPTKIFVSHPVDFNRDHQSLYLFLQVALWDLESQMNRPAVYPFLVHAFGWPRPIGFHPELKLSPPEDLAGSGISWQELALTNSEISTKRKMLSVYKTQFEFYPSYPLTYARKNELFGDYPVIELQEKNRPGETENRRIGDGLQFAPSPIPPFVSSKSGLSYTLEDKQLVIRIPLTTKLDKTIGISLYLFGYRSKMDFAKMPKLHIRFGIRGIVVEDRKMLLPDKTVQFRYVRTREGRVITTNLVLTIPLSELEYPKYILSRVTTNAGDLSLSDTAWRILHLSK